jgi:hypothetical protein
VPEAAELGAVDIEGERALRLQVRDVVRPGIRVGLHAELVRPEGVNGVERGDVQADQRVRRQHEVRHLDTAVAGKAVGECPLLPDHLDVERFLVAGGLECGGGALTPA